MIRFMAFALASLSFISIVNATPEAEKKAQEEMMQKMMTAATPGAPHKILSDLAGEFHFTSKSWESEKAKPWEGKGAASLKMILGGRWLQYEINGEPAGGMPGFTGMGLIGYDNVEKEYQTMWMDTMSTGAMIGEGKFDEKSKTLKDSGEYSCPLTGKDRDYRGQWQIKDKNSMVYSLYGTPPMDEKGKEFKMMEISFKRK